MQDDAFFCSVYSRDGDRSLYLFVCDRTFFPANLKRENWRIIAHGVQPPREMVPILKRRQHHVVRGPLFNAKRSG